MSEEAKQRISVAMKGCVRSAEQRAAISVRMRNENSPLWKGDDVGYVAAHTWLTKNFGHEKTECEDCGATDDLQWAFKGRSGGHSRNREDYRILCPRCHYYFDTEKRAA
jgi:hypothetical protein